MGAASELSVGHVIAERYRVEALIGKGGMGNVYRVRHVHTDEELALKLLHPDVLKNEEAVERFRREARAPAKIVSDHIARVTDADTASDLDGAPFYVMELLRGRDLERIVAEDGPLPAADAVEYLRQASRALDKAHAAGIIHRDLKPENLFLTHRDDGTPCIKLLDFGIARLAGSESPMQTQAGFMMGTPTFMSPEQTIGNVDLVGPGTDVWALGLVAFRILVGRDFWPAQTTPHLCAMIVSGVIPAPSERGSPHGPAFDAWFARCLQREVAARFASAGEAIEALAAALDVRLAMHSSAHFPAALTVPEPARQTAPSFASTSSPPPARSKAPLFVVAGGAIVLVAGIVALVVVLGSKKEPIPIVSAATPPPSSAPLSIVSAAPSETAADPAPPPITTATSTSTGTSQPVAKKAEPAAKHSAAKPEPPKTEGAPVSREQRRRLEALQRMCDQGTFTPAECTSKRNAILRGDP